jgi:ABC-type antimicrobial peptide transport system permease subunit
MDAGRTVPVAARIVSPRYFQTLGMIIREGRSFGDGDPPRPPVAVINESMARRLWPDASPLGRTFRIDHEGGEPIHVIGIVANASETSSAQPPQPGFYRPFPAEYAAHLTIVLRVQGDPVPFFGEIRRTVRDLAPDLSIVDLRTMQGVIDDAAEQRRVPATALAALALLGLVLSAVGLSGVIAYGVRERARELGVRLALGARPADVRWLVLRQGFRIVAAGLAAGAAGTVAFLQIARRHLFGVGAPDAAVLLAVCAVLLAAAGVALYLPARWASAIEPARTLRSE